MGEKALTDLILLICEIFDIFDLLSSLLSVARQRLSWFFRDLFRIGSFWIQILYHTPRLFAVTLTVLYYQVLH